MPPELADPAGPWSLFDFLERLDAWIDQEQPPQDVVLVVTAWVLSRVDQPYHGVRREEGFNNLWFGLVPNSAHGDGRVVVCSYWIEESAHSVRCDAFATLSYPI